MTTVTIVCPFFPPSELGAGPAAGIRGIVERSDFQIEVFCNDRDPGKDPFPQPHRGTLTLSPGKVVTYCTVDGFRSLIAFLSKLRHARGELLVLNSFHSVKFTLLPLLLHGLGVSRAKRVAIAPRGEFAGSAMALGSRLKTPYTFLWRVFRWSNRVFWIASSIKEEQEIRSALGADVRVYIVPEVPWIEAHEPCLEPPIGDFLRLLYLSRIAPIKGLRELLVSLQDACAPISLDIWGPIDDAGYWSACEALIVSLPENVVVSYRGVANRQQTSQLFDQHHALVLPTFTENFGHTIAEALAAGCPVIIGENTPWTDSVRNQAGWTVNPADARSLATLIATLPPPNADEWHRLRLGARHAFTDWQSSPLGRPEFDSVCEEILR